MGGARGALKTAEPRVPRAGQSQQERQGGPLDSTQQMGPSPQQSWTFFPGYWQNLASHELAPWEVGRRLALLPTVGAPEGAGSPVARAGLGRRPPCRHSCATSPSRWGAQGCHVDRALNFRVSCPRV